VSSQPNFSRAFKSRAISPAVIGSFEIIDDSEFEGDENLATGQPVYYDQDQDEWVQDTEANPVPIDYRGSGLDSVSEDTIYSAWENLQSGTWIPVGGGGVQSIRFELLSEIEDEPTQFTATVLSRPPGKRRVTQETDENTVIVHDMIGCLLDETAADLVGRKGYATLLETRDDYGIPTKRWEIHSLCCPE
jgi:hypothetical protein